jgi:hypothetical protein
MLMSNTKKVGAVGTAAVFAFGGVVLPSLGAGTASADCFSALGFTVGNSQQCGSAFGGVAIALGNVSTAFAGVGPSPIGNFGTVAFAGPGNNNATSGGGSTWRRRPVSVA